MAPEAMRRKQFSVKSDMFSFGVVLYELFAQTRPWSNYDSVEVIAQVISGERMTIPDNIDTFIRHVMEVCWSHDPNSRPTFPTVIEALKDFHSNKPSRDGALSVSLHEKSTISPLRKDASGTNAMGDEVPNRALSNLLVEPMVHIDDVSFFQKLMLTNPDDLSDTIKDHNNTLRMIYILLCSQGRSSKSVDMILKVFKDLQQSEFHLTITYFWIQMVTYHMKVFSCQTSDISSSNDSFSIFLAQCSFNDDVDLRNETLYEKYYSAAVMNRSRFIFNMPDIMACPSFC